MGGPLRAKRGRLSDAHSDVSSRIVSGLDKMLAEHAKVSEVDAKTLEMYHRANDLLRIPVLKDGVPNKLPPTIWKRFVCSRKSLFAGLDSLEVGPAWQKLRSGR